MIFSVNVNNNLFQRRELKDNVCYRFSRQMYSWKLPPVNSSLNGCIFFYWNSDVWCFFKMQTWHVQCDFEYVFFPLPNLTRCKFIKSKSDAFWNFYFKSDVLEKLNSKSDKFWNFFSKIWSYLLFGFWLNDDIFCQR